MCVYLDDASGYVSADAELGVALPWALAVAHGVDGFTLTEGTTDE